MEAYFYFKLAAFYGNKESLQMLALYSNYQIDGSYNLINNVENLLDNNRKIGNYTFEFSNKTKRKLLTYLEDRRHS